MRVGGVRTRKSLRGLARGGTATAVSPEERIDETTLSTIKLFSFTPGNPTSDRSPHILKSVVSYIGCRTQTAQLHINYFKELESF